MAMKNTAPTRTLAALALAALSLTACGGTGDSSGGSRNSVHAVGSSTVYPFAKLVAENFARSNTDFRSPLIESTGTPNSGDVATAAPRRVL